MNNKECVAIMILCLCLMTVALSCKQTDQTGRLNFALAMSETNRYELEKVLSHYESLRDSLKYNAACFLIENMICHVHYENEHIHDLIEEIYSISITNNVLAAVAMDSVEKKYGKISNLHFMKKYDLKTITADFLIRNIDWAFKAWQEAAWYEKITFEQFCKEILPYKVHTEPIDEHWREMFYNTFKPLIDSLQPNSYFTACQIVYDALMQKKWKYTARLQTLGIGARTLLFNRIGSCNEQALLVAYAMRSLAIPVGIDIILRNPIGHNKGHAWNYIYDENNNLVEFVLESPWRPKVGLVDSIRKKGVVYRMNYEFQFSSLSSVNPIELIPYDLRNPFLKNVSTSYFPNTYVNIYLKEIENKNSLFFLCTFDNKKWEPIYGVNLNGKAAEFKGVEPGIVYCGAMYENKKQKISTFPFYLDENNNLNYFIPDTVNRVNKMYLQRKNPISHTLEKYRRRSINGKFQVSNDPSFTSCKTLFQITDTLELRWYEVDLYDGNKYKYARYLSGDNGYSNMAEIAFFSKGKKMTGRIIGTNEFVPNDRSNRDKSAVFDNDPLTFFDALQPSGSWAGLEFIEPTEIDKIEFIFRNDDNMIRDGDLYELFYFAKGEKVSLGTRLGTKNGVLIYENTPSNALFLLHNHTRGQEERIFTYENDKQIWW